MKIFKRKIIALISLAMALFVLFTAIPFNTTKVNALDYSVEAEDALRDKIKDLETKKKEKEQEIKAAEGQKLETEKELEYLNSLIFTTNEELVATETLIEKYEESLETTRQQIEATNLQLEKNFESLKVRLNHSYVEGNATYLEMLLNSESFVDFLMSAERVGYMLESDRKLLEETEIALEQLEIQEAQYDIALKEQKQLKIEYEEVIEESEKLTEQANIKIAQLEEEHKDLKEDYDALIEMEEDFNEDIEAILAARAAAEKNAASSNQNYSPTFTDGKFITPLPAGTYRISSEYGWRTLWGRQNFHLGIDMAAPAGTPVYAAASGTVVTSAYHYSYGYYVLIDHGGGYATLYAHNSALYVSAGSYVAQGQKIAGVGTTGSSSGNHLHFEVRINSKTQNPRGYVPF